MAVFSITKFKTNQEAENNGIWVTLEHGLRLCVARANNPKYISRLRELMAPHLNVIRSIGKRYKRDADKAQAEVPTDVMEACMREAMAETILLGWDNMGEPSANGNSELTTIPYSKEKALEYMTEYRDFFLVVSEIANDESLYREETLEDSRGNSLASLSGT